MGRVRAVAGVLLLSACIVGVRGEATFEAEHDLEGVRELRIDLPSTPMEIFACDASLQGVCPAEIRYSGRWRSVAGTRSDARDRAEEPQLVFETLEGFAELRAVVPLDVRGTVDLEIDAIDVPDDRALDVRTDRGDVQIVGTQASVSVDVTVGDIEVVGGDAGVGIWVDIGDVVVASPGVVDVAVDEGNIEVVQTAGGQEAFLRTERGNVELVLADDTNIDLQVRASGDIRVNTPNIVAITKGRFDRRTGDGALRVTISTQRGSVTIRSPLE